MKAHPVKRYFWLVDTIYRNGPISFAEVARRWQQSALFEGNELAIRTFHNHREAIEELFLIRIECDDRSNKYYIEDKEGLKSGSASAWLLNTFSISNILSEAQSLGSRVQVEDIPSSGRYLSDILAAMRENRCITILYHPFSAIEPFELTLQPLITKLIDRRWYLYASKPNDPKVKLYALDRFEGCSVLDKRFDYPTDFDAESYTKDVVGVAIYDRVKPEKIRIRTNRRHAKYMESLPLHHSQTKIAESEKHIDFEYFVSPTPELYNKLLAYGRDIEVLSPAKVRSEMYSLTTSMANLYSHKMESSKVGRAVRSAARVFPNAKAKEVAQSLEMMHDTLFVERLEACILYLEAVIGWEYAKSLKLDDTETLALFESGDTDGVFIYESHQVRDKLRQGVKSIDDLVEVNIAHHHPKALPKPYSYALVQALVSYFGGFIKCHYPREFKIFFE